MHATFGESKQISMRDEGSLTMRLVRIVPLLALAALPITAAAKTHVYRNLEFGIVVPIPHGLYLFPPHQMTGIDHGRQLFFKPTSVEDCNNGGCDRYIGFFAGCNCFEGTKHLHDFLEAQCTVFGGKDCLESPPELGIKGLKSESARIKLPNGKVEILVVTQAGKPAPDFDATVPSINYSIYLLTSEENLEQDMKFFRIILETIRISPPN
ncbi:MAG: hypothetical protein WBQ94_12715 [Terracidiphilus sp.]